jgi:hypothetical protein
MEEQVRYCIKKVMHSEMGNGHLWQITRILSKKVKICSFYLLFITVSVIIASFLHSSAVCAQSNRIKTVLILGNSIVLHSPKPEIGWYGEWGMAASVRDSDFVHLLIRDIHEKDSTVVVKFSNIAEFERNFDSFQFSDLDSLINPDMLIMKISENVDDAKAIDDDFTSYFDKLVKHITPENRSVRVIVDGFWKKECVNRFIAEYALKNKYLFITTTDLSGDSTNTAAGKFLHKGVAAHPSDKGMRMIEKRIWDKIKCYF